MTIISLHLLQNHAPSNLNRDDNGDPKDTFFGGVRRARISSQALKRSIRWANALRETFKDRPELLGTRTQLLPNEVRKRLTERTDITEQERDAIVAATTRLGKSEASSQAAESATAESKKKGKKERSDGPPKTAQLMFLATHEIDALAEQMVKLVRERGVAALDALSGDKLVDAIGEYEPHAVDIAMFGRMTTSSPFKNVDAAVQVAHAFSTHAVEQEFDYYTAVDDISGEAGAGFIGETSFNSATYYKYFSIDLNQLTENLNNDQALAYETVRTLIEAAVKAIPTGKQNSFAAHNLPDLVVVEVRDDRQPMSYANAFVKPVRARGDQSLMEASIMALTDYIGRCDTMYGGTFQRAVCATLPVELMDAIKYQSLADLIAGLPLKPKPQEAQ